jgi:hypothetical protein
MSFPKVSFITRVLRGQEEDEEQEQEHIPVFHAEALNLQGDSLGGIGQPVTDVGQGRLPDVVNLWSEGADQPGY